MKVLQFIGVTINNIYIMKTRILFTDEGQELQYLDIDTESGRVCRVSPRCPASIANLYIGGIVDTSAVQQGDRLQVADPANAGKVFQSRWYIAEVQSL
jgi:hypothetical protein